MGGYILKIRKNAKIIIVVVLALLVAVGAFFVVWSFFKHDKYTVTFLPNAENVYYYAENGQRKPVPEEGIIQEGVESADQIKVPVFSKPGYNFKGWSDSLYHLDSDKTFKALWEEQTIVITYNGNGGNLNGETIIQKIDITDGYDAWTRAPQFVREGYELSWDKTEEEFAQITTSCTINAVWIPKTYNLIFKDQYGNNFANNTMQATYNNLLGGISVVAPKVEGKRFSHWVDENGLPIDKGIKWTLDEDLILKPCYVDADKFIITYDLDGGERQGKIYSFDENLQEFPVSNPIKRGCIFVGWLINGRQDPIKSENITVDDLKIDGKISDVSLKAVWAGATYYIDFKVDGGTISNNNPLPIIYGNAISGLPTAYKEGYIFDGWFYNGQKIEDGDISLFDQSVTLTAKYLYTYKIKFSLTTKVYGNAVDRKLDSWGDLPHEVGQDIEDIVIEIIEGQSLKDVIEGFSELPVANTDPDNDNLPNAYRYLGYWKWYPSKTSYTSVKIYPDTVFVPNAFDGVKGGGTITIVPACQAVWSPFV